jgi:hypothetical protein
MTTDADFIIDRERVARTSARTTPAPEVGA